MNKSDLSKRVTQEFGISIKGGISIVELVLDLIEEEIVSGGEVSLHGFGTLKTVERAERECLNPQTKEKMIVPAKKTVTFKVSKALKDKVNN